MSLCGKPDESNARNRSTTGRLCGRSGSLIEVDYRLAETEAEKEAIYGLRYRAYLHEGAIEPRAISD